MNAKIVILIAALACQASANVAGVRRLNSGSSGFSIGNLGGASGGFKLPNIAGGIASNIGGAIEKGVDQMNDAVGNVVGNFEGAGAGLSEAVGNAVEQLQGGVAEAGAGLSEAWENAQNVAGEIQGNIENAFSGIIKMFQEGVGKAVCQMQQHANKMLGMGKEMADKAKEFYGKMGKVMCSVSSQIINEGKANAKALLSKMIEMRDKLRSQKMEAFLALANKIQEILNNVSNGVDVSGSMQSFIDSATALAQQGSTQVQQMMGEMAQTLAESQEGMTEALESLSAELLSHNVVEEHVSNDVVAEHFVNDAVEENEE